MINKIWNNWEFSSDAVTTEDQDQLLELCHQIWNEWCDDNTDQDVNFDFAYRTYEEILAALNENDRTFMNNFINNFNDQYLIDPDSKTPVSKQFIALLKKLKEKYIPDQWDEFADSVNVILH